MAKKKAVLTKKNIRDRFLMDHSAPAGGKRNNANSGWLDETPAAKKEKIYNKVEFKVVN